VPGFYLFPLDSQRDSSAFSGLSLSFLCFPPCIESSDSHLQPPLFTLGNINGLAIVFIPALSSTPGVFRGKCRVVPEVFRNFPLGGSLDGVNACFCTPTVTLFSWGCGGDSGDMSPQS